MFRSSASRKFVLLSAAVSSLSFLPQSQGQTWKNPVSGNWSVGTNWVGDVAPASAATTSLTFGASGASSYTASNDIGSFSLNKITGNSTSSGLITLDGSTLSFGGTAPTIIQSGSGAIQVSSAIELAATTAIGGTGAGTINLAGLLSSNPAPDVTAGNGITLSNAAARLQFSGSGSARYLIASSGSVYFTGGNYNFTSNAYTSAETAMLIGTTAAQTATVNITSGEVDAGNVRMGSAANATGVLNVSGPTAKLVTSPADPATTGDLFSVAGTASITVSNGGKIQTPLFDLGYSGSGSSNVLVTGAGSNLKSSFAALGWGSAASASVENLTIANNATFDCYALTSFGHGEIIPAYGDRVSSTLAVQSGGQVNTDGDFFLGYQETDTGGATANATLSISGSGSAVNLIAGAAMVTCTGYSGTIGGNTTISISNGGLLNTELFLGGQAIGTNTVIVNGTGSQFNVNSAGISPGYIELGVAIGSSQIIRYEAGATGTNNAEVHVAAVGGSSGTFTVSGAGSTFTQVVTGDLNNPNFFHVSGAYIDNNGSLTTGVVEVLNGGSLTADYFDISSFGQTNSTGSLTVDGANSAFSSSIAFLALEGASSKAVVTVSNGGVADFGLLLAGAAEAGAAGTIVGSATINIQSGGLVNAQYLDLATNVGTAVMNVDGTNSQFVAPNGADSQIVIADDIGAQGTLNITNGGAVAVVDVTTDPDTLDGAIFLAPSAGSIGTINLSGTQSFLGAGFLGIAGSGSVAVSGGTGIVNQSGGNALFGAVRVYNNGTYNLSGGTYSTLQTTVDGRFNYNGGIADVGTLAVAGQVIFSAGNNKTLKAGFVTTSGAGKIDLADNAMVVDDETTSAASQLSSIRDQVKTGRSTGNWLGNGITSSTAAAAPNVKGVGVIKASDTGTTSFRGVAVTSTGVLVRTTYLGDTDLDGDVDSIDFGRLAGKYGQVAGSNWIDGDFNYDDKVSTLDFNYLAGNFGAAVLPSPVAGPVVDGSDPLYGLDPSSAINMNRIETGIRFHARENELVRLESHQRDRMQAPGGLGSVVPEPTSFAAIGVAALGLPARRRRA